MADALSRRPDLVATIISVASEPEDFVQRIKDGYAKDETYKSFQESATAPQQHEW